MPDVLETGHKWMNPRWTILELEPNEVAGRSAGGDNYYSPVSASVFQVDPEDWLSKIFIRLWIWRHKAYCCKVSKNQTLIDKFFIPIYEFMMISAAGLAADIRAWQTLTKV